MNFKNIYIHERRLFVCFVSMVHETYQFGLLVVRCCTSFVACFGTSIGTITVNNNNDPPPFYPSCSHRIKHQINQLLALHCKCKKSCTKSKGFLFFFVILTQFLLLKASIIYFMSTIIATRICYNALVSLWTSCLYNKQACSKMPKSHSLSRNCCSSSSLHHEKKCK